MAIRVVTTTKALIDIERTEAILLHRIVQGINIVAENAMIRALQDVPVRKVFGVRRTRSVWGGAIGGDGVNKNGNPLRSRQDTRVLSIEEALSEESTRRRVGLPSAFPTDTAGRRVRGATPSVQTAQITPTYRARSRGNEWNDSRREIAFVQGEKHIVGQELIDAERPKIGHKNVPLPEVEADLSRRGRYELKRADTSAASAGGTSTLGGALRKSIRLERAEPGRVMTARISAGGGDVTYAKYVEFGTRRSRAQPFLRPAKAQAKLEYPSILKRALLGEELLGKGG